MAKEMDLQIMTEAEVAAMCATEAEVMATCATEAEVMAMCAQDMQKMGGDIEIETLRRYPKIRRRGKARPGKGQLNFKWGVGGR